MEPNDIPPRVFFSSQTHCCRRRSLNPIPTSTKKKDRRLSLSFSTVRKPDGRSWGKKKKSVSSLPKSCDSFFWSRQNTAAPSCEGYRAAGGELRSYSKYGTQLDFSPFPSVRPLLCFDCLPPPPVARFASLPSSQLSQTSSSPAARDSRWRRLSPRRQPARWATPRWILGSRV